MHLDNDGLLSRSAKRMHRRRLGQLDEPQRAVWPGQLGDLDGAHEPIMADRQRGWSARDSDLLCGSSRESKRSIPKAMSDTSEYTAPASSTVRSAEYRRDMHNESARQSQQLAVTILSNGHNTASGTTTQQTPYTPAAYHPPAASLLAATLLIVAVITLLMRAGLASVRSRPSSQRISG